MIEVAAAILEKSGKVLIARRKTGKDLAGFWEFPGGKIQANETARQCLFREIKEELGVDIELKTYVGESVHRYPEYEVRLLAFTGHLLQEEMIPTDHDILKWVHISELDQYKIAPADIPIIELYKTHS